jgi:AmmeMemoRadiSam system protein A
MTDDADRQTLLRIAREAVAAHVSGGPAPSCPSGGAGARTGAAFVTLHSHGELRGCIGHIEADEPLGVIIARCAVAACSADPRFRAITARELPELELELSLLGRLEPVSSADEIEVGRHGLVIEMGRRRGLLLPQVATERGWDRDTFLAHTCQKAGLPKEAWKQGAKLWRFEAEVFYEAGPGDRASDAGHGSWR